MSSPARSCLAIVLSAGEGVRMRSQRPKPMHEIAGRSMLAHALAAVKAVGAGEVAVVVGPNAPEVEAEARRAIPEASIFVQAERRGTAHAVLAAREAIARGYDDVLVAYADIPLIRGETLAAMRAGLAEGAAVVALGFAPADPTGYGRLIEQDGRLVAIREHKDATAEERKARLCNAGPIAFSGAEALAMLDAIRPQNAQNEYYLTDTVEHFVRGGKRVRPVPAGDHLHVLGVNDRVELALARKEMNARLCAAHMREGVTIVDPAAFSDCSIFITSSP